jgi:hypothetical protein
MLGGRFIVCPVVMNHHVEIEIQADGRAFPPGYWRELEQELTAQCGELVILPLPGWEQSRGMRREIDLFLSAERPIFHFVCDGTLQPFEPR